ncbi:MAG: 4-hydroxythreonine-4-phosphate dehydrogenase PdxA [Candidatus Melainabacteria bacterium 35_41]|nr:MAG: 4-hydroxythreonine-4-phosphate dehydrogenase PdxA [Candidatus Melainabacteria bacterium 35_41]
MSKIAVTTGDPNGIGAEITIKALNKLDLPEDKIVIISNKKIIDFYGKLNRNYDIIEIPYEAEIEPGKVTKEAGEFSFLSVKKACETDAKAIVTAPVAKNALYLAGHRFNGQTEILQKYLAHNNQLAEMLFVAGKFRVLLLTRHVALKDINLTKEMVVEKITNLRDFFVTHLNISKPEFALCAFNPHAGEDGILGHEEIDILIPAVEELRANGINITNPLPADTLFIKALDYDCCIANYHDQGLIPIKTVAGDKTVNMTIGLDIIRTSPGHGTAFDIAGKNVADETGMIEAIKAVL